MHELESLQDRVPPFATWRAKRILKKELKRKGKTLSVFTVFPKTSIAAGSLGQVYECFLDDGTRVAVKIQRPGIDKKIARDIEALRILARYAASHTGIGMGVNWDDVVEEFADTIRMELDFGREMENAEKFRDNFKAWKDIYVPIFYPEYCTKKVLVMEFIDGLKLNDLPALSAADKDPMDGVRIVTRSYLKQLIQDGFFHADPHPGNLRLLEDGRVAFFDFGMAGSIDDEQKSMVLDLLIHVAEQDIHAINDNIYWQC
jgi:predicted unusual protein kinase regulating ubiquinone biosynthesis (AarF/ABC1/UbiB family)